MFARFFKFFLFIVMLAGFSTAHAGCSFYSGSYMSKYITAGSVIVQRDLAVGQTFKSYAVSQGGYPSFWCGSSPWTLIYKLGQFTTPSGMANVYNTNVPGVGVRISSDLDGYVPTSVALGANTIQTAVTMTTELVKTGPITAGALNPGKLTILGVSGGMDGFDISVPSGVNITPVACSINTTNLTFPIGDVLSSKFSTSVGTIPTGAQNTQSLGLNCDAGANINVSLSGTQNPDVGTTSVLALTGQGGANVAKGVGVQIIYNGSPLVLNNRILLKNSSGGQETFPLTARYYQTKTAVATGTANSSATLNLTYQ